MLISQSNLCIQVSIENGVSEWDTHTGERQEKQVSQKSNFTSRQRKQRFNQEWTDTLFLTGSSKPALSKTMPKLTFACGTFLDLETLLSVSSWIFNILQLRALLKKNEWLLSDDIMQVVKNDKLWLVAIEVQSVMSLKSSHGKNLWPYNLTHWAL